MWRISILKPCLPVLSILYLPRGNPGTLTYLWGNPGTLTYLWGNPGTLTYLSLTGTRLSGTFQHMARFARIVIPDMPHHVTQRGNRRQEVFFSDEDREEYLRYVREACA